MPITAGYTANFEPLILGQIVDGQLINSISKNNTSGNALFFGAGVIADGEDGIQLGAPTLTAPPETTSDFIGVVMYTHDQTIGQNDDVGVQPEREATVVTLGAVAVKVATAVTTSSSVYLGVDGEFRADNDGGAATLILNAKFTKSAGAGDIAKLSLRIGG